MSNHQSNLFNDILKRIENIDNCDILIGIPSYNNANTIAHVAKSAVCGVKRFFPNLKAVFINSDGGSHDNTRDIFLNVIDDDVLKFAFSYIGIPGKGSALKAIFEIACKLNVKACVVVDSDLRSITGEWIKLLSKPIIDREAEYITPYYIRHKYDGTITNNIAYPLSRALYGQRIRQPIGGDFGFSGKLAEVFLSKDVWDGPVAKYGIDIFMTTTVLNEGFSVGQANLGAKIHDAKDPSKDLGPMFVEVVLTLMNVMKTYKKKWQNIHSSKDTARFGVELDIEPEPLEVNLLKLIQNFKEGFDNNISFWKTFLPAQRINEITDIYNCVNADNINFPARTWAKTVYDFAIEVNFGNNDVSKVISSMIPLYFGRTGSFVLETANMTTKEAEDIIIKQAEIFEENKDYLISNWKE